MITLDQLVNIDPVTGYSYADFPTFLQYEIEGYQAIYGNDTYLGDDSQDGQRLSSQAQAKYDTAAKGAMTYLSFFPDSAQGTGLSRIVKINGLRREDPSFSTVTLTIVGTAGTVITDGQAQDNLGQLWDLPSTVTIPGGGTIDVTATAAVEGAVFGEPNTITILFTPTLGWQTVNNAAGAIPGAAVETDGTLRQRQEVSTSLPAQTVFDATIGAVENVSGVTEVKGYENDTGSTDANGIPAHKISLVVAGGTDNDVATAIMLKKTPGTGTYGTTAVPLTDPKGMPITINFYRPTVATIGVQVTITPGAGYSSDYDALIAQAVADVVNAVPIGGTVILTRLFLPAYLQNTPAFGTYEVDSIELQKNGGGFALLDIALLFNEIPVCDPATDVVVIP